MKIYTVMINIFDDCSGAIYNELNDDDLVFTTRGQAQNYIDKQKNPNKFFILELELIGD